MKPEIRERREYMMNEYGRSFSEKQAIDATANKFHVSTETLYVDWSRRQGWLKELVKLSDNDDLIRQLIVQIQMSLNEADELKNNADNDNCRLGAIKLKINTLFKLMNFLHNYDAEELRERIEKLERIVDKGVVIP